MPELAAEVERLRARLLERDVTIEEVWEYLLLQHQPNAGMVMQAPANFIEAQDLSHFWSLYDWWAPVEGKPANLPIPTIMQFCWNINHMPDVKPMTFMDTLWQFYHKGVAHCTTHDLDPANPGESKEARRKRKNREQMALARASRKVPEKLLQGDSELALAVRSLEAKYDTLKAQARDADAAAAADVKVHYEAMMVASDSRKAVAAAFKASLEEVRNEILSLTAKQ
jgi:hypothetical protein